MFYVLFFYHSSPPHGDLHSFPTRRSSDLIADAVSSVLWADEIVVADSGSTDRTAAIAQSLGARVVQLPFDGFGDLRNRAIAECRHEWIFSLDSDERCTAEVRDEIFALLSSPPDHDA